MKKIKTVNEWCDFLGFKTPDFSGADSYVWLRGNDVVKLTYVRAGEIRLLRQVIRANFSGCPVAQIKSCRLLGPCIIPYTNSSVGVLFKIIQERVTTEQIHGYKNPGCKSEDNLPLVEWEDCDGNYWYQADDLQSNASTDGRWLDFGAILPIKVNPHKPRIKA